MSHLPLLAVFHLPCLVPLGKLFGQTLIITLTQTSTLVQASRRLPVSNSLFRARSSVYVSKGTLSPLCTEGVTCFINPQCLLHNSIPSHEYMNNLSPLPPSQGQEIMIFSTATPQQYCLEKRWGWEDVSIYSTYTVNNQK